MAITINGDTGVSGVDGTVSNPALEGTDSNTGVYFPAADTVGLITNGSERMRVDSSGNVGIGTSSPASKLHVSGSFRQTGATVPFEWTVNAGANDYYKLNAVGYADNLIVANSAGNVGIGTTSPSGRLHVYGGDQYYEKASSGEVYAFYRNGIGEGKIQINNVGQMLIGTTATGGKEVLFTVNNTERMRIDSSGNLLVGTTSSDPIGAKVAGMAFNPSGTQVNAMANGLRAGAFGRYTSTGGLIELFYYGASLVQVGTISTNGTGTTYGTSSDYRLKYNVQPLTVGLSTISQLKPVTYKWKSDDSYGEGFIAHELQTVIPNAVSGEKDSVKEDGSIDPQSVDYSKIVVHLVAAIQELKAELDALKAKVGS